MTSAFDSFGHRALVFCASASLAARANLPVIRDIAAQEIDLFVVDDRC